MAIGNTQLGTDTIPVGSALVPGNPNPVPVQGSTLTTTDNQGNTTTPVNINLKQFGDVIIAIGQQLKAASIPVTLPSDQIVNTLDTNSASNNTHLGNIDTATSDLVADLDALIANTTGLATQASLSTVVARLTSILADLGAFADTFITGNVTSDNDVVAISCPGGQATAYVKVTGSFVGTLLFEGTPDGGTNWDAMNAVAVGASTVATQTTTTGAWRVNVSGLTSFRVKLHPTTSGTANIRINLSQGVHNVAVTNTNALGQQASSNSSSVVVASDQIVPVKSAFNEIAISGTGVVNGINTDPIPSTDVSAYKWLSFHVTGTFSLTYTFQGSNDNANWVSINLFRVDIPGFANAGTSSTATNLIWTGPVQFRYFRVRATAFTSNTSLAGFLELYTQTPGNFAANNIQVNQGNNVGTTPWLVGGSNNNAVQAANTAGNVVVKGSAGLLQGAMITATGTAGLTVYDNASTNSGTPVLIIPANPVVGTLYPVNGWCKNGIVSAGVANCPGVTFFFA